MEEEDDGNDDDDDEVGFLHKTSKFRERYTSQYFS
jgi:hypothetical protein